MVFIGIDPSLTATGIVAIDENYKIINTEIISTPIFGVERLFHLEQKLDNFLKPFANEKKFTAIERGAYRETGRIFDLGEWSGVIKLNIFKKETDMLIVAPLQLKKFATGKGKNEGKSVVILEIYKKWGEEFHDDNVADAYVLARICHNYFFSYRTETKVALTQLKPYELDVLKKIYEEHDKIKSLI